MSMFEIASKKKFRFVTPKGHVSVEDLWDLPLTSTVGKANLDDIAKDLDGQLNTTRVKSFVHEETEDPSSDIRTMFDIVLHIIAFKVAERNAESKERAKRAEKQRLLEALARSEDKAIESKTPAEIRAMIDAL